MKRLGRYLVRWWWLRVYINGSFSKVEINLGRIAHWELVWHLFTIKGQKVMFNINPPIEVLERRILMDKDYCI